MWPAQAAVRNTTFLHNTRPLITADFRHLDMVHCESLTDLSGPLWLLYHFTVSEAVFSFVRVGGWECDNLAQARAH